MIAMKKALPRRTFLRGAGVTLALPFLDAMLPAFTPTAVAAVNSIRRLGFVYIPMGMSPSEWIPQGEGKLKSLSPSLAALEPFLDQITVITNTELKDMAYPTGNHAASNAIFLSATRPKRTEGSDYELATTVDQVAARQLGKETAIPSLELATDLIAQTGNCDNGLACAYQNNLSWSSPTTPLPAEADPRLVFERLFGDGGTAQDRRNELRKNKSILDWITRDMTRHAGERRLYYPYPDEYRSLPPNMNLLRALAEETGGKLAPEIGEIFAAQGDRGSSRTPMWPWFAGIALLLYLCDIAVRRAPWFRHWLEGD